MNIHYTEDLDDIKDQGITFYNDPDETAMELYQDGKLVCSTFIDDFCQEHNINFQDDKCYVYELFIDTAYQEDWLK